MTLRADSKKRVVLPGAAPGDVFTCESKGHEMVLRRVYRLAPRKKCTKKTGAQGDSQLEVQIRDELGAASGSYARAMTLLDARRKSGRGKAPTVPLPDSFIGAYGLLGWKLATRNVERCRIYFPSVELIAPPAVP